MRQPVLVAGGGGDNAASAVGVGAISPGDGFVSLGTSGVLFLVTDRFRPNPVSAVHAFCHALPQRWHQMSVMLSAASCLRWATHLSASTDEAALLAQVARLDAQACAGAPQFLPYLSGERTPHNDARAQGVLFGITHDTDAARLGYAVLEGVTFGLADGLSALFAAGSHAEVLSLVGGGARSSYWAQLIADVFGIPVCTHSGGEAGAALGAARLGWLACGGAQAEVCVKPPVEREFVPDAARGGRLAPRRERFRALYPALKPLFG
jgi:xylulokinase